MTQVSSKSPNRRSFNPFRLIPKARRDKVLRDGALLAFSATASSVIMLGYQVFVARELQPAAYSTFGALLGVIAIVSQGGNALQLTAARDVARLSGTDENERIREYIGASLSWAAISFVVVLVLILPFTPLIADVLDMSFTGLLILALVVGAGYVPLSTLRGNLQGLERFRALSMNRVGEKVVLVIFGGALVASGMGIEGAMIGLAGALLAMLLFGAYALYDLRPIRVSLRPQQMIRPSIVVLLTAVGVALLANIDALIAKSIFPDEDAGVFNVIGRLGKVMFFIALAFNRALFPRSARLSAEGKPALGILLRGLLVVSAGSLVIVALSIPFSEVFLEVTVGESFAGSPDLVPWYLLAMSLVAMAAVVLYYNLSLGSRMHLLPLGLGVGIMLSLFTFQPGTMFQLIASMIGTFAVVLGGGLLITVLDLRSTRKRMNELDDQTGQPVE